MPIYPRLIAIHEFLFLSKANISKSKTPIALRERRRDMAARAASNPMAISCNELWQHYCTMLHKYVTVKPESEKKEKTTTKRTVAVSAAARF